MATKSDLVAVEEATLKSMFSQKIDMTKRSDSFSLCDRDKVLIQVIPYHNYCHIVMCLFLRFCNIS
jgi:hypothetical protein